MATEGRRAGRSGYIVALVIFLAGVVIAVALLGYLAYTIYTLDGRLQRMVVPGTAELELEDTGRYTVFYEYRSTVDGRDFRTGERLPQLNIEVTNVDTGEPIPVSSAFGNTTYDVWNRAGESIATFRIDDPGTYAISAEYIGDPNGQDIVLALGEGIGTTILLSVGAGLASGLVFCLTTVIAIIVVIITAVRRRNEPQAPAGPSSAEFGERGI